MWGEPQYDAHQFAGKRAKAVSPTTGIAHSDYERMHMERRKPSVARRKPIPEWVNNDTLLGEMVLKFSEDYLYLRDRSGTSAERLQRIADESARRLPRLRQELERRLEEFNQLTKERAPEKCLRRLGIIIANRDSQILILQRGLPALIAAVLTYSYRLGQDSVTVAEQLKLKPPMVRIWLYRCNRMAAGKKKSVPHTQFDALPMPKKSRRKLFKMRARGYSLAKCARVLGGCVSTTRLYKIVNQKFDGKWEGERLQRLADLRASGLSWNQCAKRLGTATSYAIKVWRKNFGDLN